MSIFGKPKAIHLSSEYEARQGDTIYYQGKVEVPRPRYITANQEQRVVKLAADFTIWGERGSCGDGSPFNGNPKTRHGGTMRGVNRKTVNVVHAVEHVAAVLTGAQSTVNINGSTKHVPEQDFCWVEFEIEKAGSLADGEVTKNMRTAVKVVNQAIRRRERK